MKLDDWLEALAAKRPTPGGGAAAALSAAIAAALAGMVSSYTTGPKWPDREERMREIAAEAAGLRTEAIRLIDADEAAYSAVSAAYKLPKDGEKQRLARKSAIQAALLAACEPPETVIRVTVQVIALLEQLSIAGNPSVMSDVAVAASQARSAIDSAIVNIEINLAGIDDDKERRRLGVVIKDTAAPLKRTDDLVISVRAVIAK